MKKIFSIMVLLLIGLSCLTAGERFFFIKEEINRMGVDKNNIDKSAMDCFYSNKEESLNVVSLAIVGRFYDQVNESNPKNLYFSVNRMYFRWLLFFFSDEDILKIYPLACIEVNARCCR